MIFSQTYLCAILRHISSKLKNTFLRADRTIFYDPYGSFSSRSSVYQQFCQTQNQTFKIGVIAIFHGLFFVILLSFILISGKVIHNF